MVFAIAVLYSHLNIFLCQPLQPLSIVVHRHRSKIRDNQPMYKKKSSHLFGYDDFKRFYIHENLLFHKNMLQTFFGCRHFCPISTRVQIGDIQIRRVICTFSL